jgi:hypothetical protein
VLSCLESIAPTAVATPTTLPTSARGKKAGDLEKRQKGQFEWPVPDATNIGAFQRGTISDRDRSAINRTLSREVDPEKLWAELEPVIRERRSARQIFVRYKLKSENWSLLDEN